MCERENERERKTEGEERGSRGGVCATPAPRCEPMRKGLARGLSSRERPSRRSRSRGCSALVCFFIILDLHGRGFVFDCR